MRAGTDAVARKLKMAIPPKCLIRSHPGTLEPNDHLFVLQLPTGGASPHSLRATTNIRGFIQPTPECQTPVGIADIYQQPERAAVDRIVVVSMLAKPLRLRRVVGSLSDSPQVLSAFGRNGQNASSVNPAGDVPNEG
jgi:hypothetical protein